jgi:hypothetical protein
MKEYPEPDESKWPANAKLSNGHITFDNSLIPIVSDGLRGYICTVCGKTITEAHHIKPACYKVIINGEIYYAERHVCEACMLVHKAVKLMTDMVNK